MLWTQNNLTVSEKVEIKLLNSTSIKYKKTDKSLNFYTKWCQIRLYGHISRVITSITSNV